ncbi:hypothetical protein EDD27_1457 [Nonomuraea polychroma]|uniref:Uncharacterized protein n=1 Tax=Nonomuraea polychroma TaxID=46176 RepID=A0A438LZZ2_9ACTN|nr:hypothetical protein [Nonomuraea polychroma]RVX39115.1 hypothetical protein EDD27_1457 [Nonomuraea polychroma]
MAATIRLSSDGPHSDEYTRQVADALSESVRVLNHATATGAGLASPATVYDVLGRASATIAGFDQLLRQIGKRLQRHLASGRLGDDHGDPASTVEQTLAELAAARQAAHTLTRRLERAFNATASLHLMDESEN